MNSRLLVSLACLISFGIAGSANAADSWKLANLNPFKKSSSSKRARASISDEPAGRGFPRISMPSWPTKSKKPARKSEPSTLAKVNQGTKAFLGKTKNVLMPWTADSKKPTPRYGAAKKPAKKSFFSSWFGKKEEPKKIRTVPEFLELDRPEF